MRVLGIPKWSGRVVTSRPSVSPRAKRLGFVQDNWAGRSGHRDGGAEQTSTHTLKARLAGESSKGLRREAVRRWNGLRRNDYAVIPDGAGNVVRRVVARVIYFER